MRLPSHTNTHTHTLMHTGRSVRDSTVPINVDLRVLQPVARLEGLVESHGGVPVPTKKRRKNRGGGRERDKSVGRIEKRRKQAWFVLSNRRMFKDGC